MHPFRRSAILIGLLGVGATRAADDLDMPPPPAAARNKPPVQELPADAGPAQQAARDRWKPWDREDKPGPRRLPDASAPASVMTPMSARQPPAAQEAPLQPIPRETLSRTSPTEMPPAPGSAVGVRQPLDQSLLGPALSAPTAKLEVFPAPAPLSDCNLDLPLTPPMLGDQVSPFLPANNSQYRLAIVHQLGASRFKIADNNSPLPDQRGLASFNVYSDPFDQGGRLYKGTGGVEFAGWNRRVSLDIRAGAGVFASDDESNHTFATNPSAVFKVLFLDGANLKMSSGLGVSFPNGDTPEGAVQTDFIVSPFLGWVWASAGSAWFLHGFEQFDIPKHGEDPYRLQSDVGVGYWIRRNDPTKLITALAPTAELHLYTPFDRELSGDREGLPSDHVLNGTLGVTLYFGPGDSIAIGVGAPLTGNQHYEWEGHVHFVHRF